MQTSYKRFSVLLGFGLLLILLLTNALVTRRQLAVQVDNQYWVEHTHQVLAELSQAQTLVTDAETGQRGFLYTGDAKYLEPYNLAASQIDTPIDRLAELTADNPDQQARVAQLRSLAHAKLSELAQTIALYRAGKKDDAKALVISDRGLFLMNDIRKLTGEMGQEETSLQSVRLARYQRSVEATFASIYAATGIAALGLAFLAFFILRAMRAREQHAAELRVREEWYRTTLSSIGDAVIATDAAGRVSFLNPVAEHLLGRDLAGAKGKAIGEIFSIFHEVTRQPVESPVNIVMERGHIVGLANHTVVRRADGTFLPIEDSAAPIFDDGKRIVGVVLVFRDATQERKLQDVLRKTEKLAAAARLAATVSHEINNPLEAVGNLIYIARTTPGLPTPVAEHLTVAEEELGRVAHVARQTLGFYRETKGMRPISLPALVERVLSIYASKLRNKQLKVETEFGWCPPVQGLDGELTQVVSNLISNAVDAVGVGGTIRLALTCVEHSDGPAVQLSVEDDGVGIAPENMANIFEPFFTTKKDVGTGLGLWVSREIVDRHGGNIKVVSPRGNGALSGSVFNVFLPVSGGGESARPDGAN
jgi:PAS domain S-box-containing protein